MSRNSSGSRLTKPWTSEGLPTSICTGWTLTPSPASLRISSASSFRMSTRRAVRTSLSDLGEVRANSRAVERPIPEEAPVTFEDVSEYSWVETVLLLRGLMSRTHDRFALKSAGHCAGRGGDHGAGLQPARLDEEGERGRKWDRGAIEWTVTATDGALEAAMVHEVRNCNSAMTQPTLVTI